MLRLAHHGRAAVDAAARVDELCRVQQVAAVITLVATRLVVAADRAGAFHQPVGQEFVLRFGVKLLLFGLEQILVLQ